MTPRPLEELQYWSRLIARCQEEHTDCWVHLQRDSDVWTVVERGDLPMGFYGLSGQHPLFWGVRFTEPWLVGDRLVASERVWELQDDGVTFLDLRATEPDLGSPSG